MEEIKRLAATTLTENEVIIYNNLQGAIVRTIALNNANAADKEATLHLDGVAFIIPLKAKETKFLDSTMVINNLKATGQGINIHVSGIQL